MKNTNDFKFYLEEALSVARTDRLQVRHKDWDNFVPVDDVISNIVFLIKDNKLDVADLNRRVWEVK
jgi:hypothetical protein